MTWWSWWRWPTTSNSMSSWCSLATLQWLVILDVCGYFPPRCQEGPGRVLGLDEKYTFHLSWVFRGGHGVKINENKSLEMLFVDMSRCATGKKRVKIQQVNKWHVASEPEFATHTQNWSQDGYLPSKVKRNIWPLGLGKGRFPARWLWTAQEWKFASQPFLRRHATSEISSNKASLCPWTQWSW